MFRVNDVIYQSDDVIEELDQFYNEMSVSMIKLTNFTINMWKFLCEKKLLDDFHKFMTKDIKPGDSL